MNNEETLIVNGQNNEETQVVNNTVANDESTLIDNTLASEKKGMPKWGKVAIGGVIGVGLGVGGFFGGQEAYAAITKDNKKVDDDEEDDKKEDEKNEDGFDVNDEQEDLEVAVSAGGVSVDEGIEVAVVSDKLSFKDAFDEAREEVGPGGVFEWHGNIYTTYTTDEWDNLSPEEMGEFVSHITVDQEAYALAHQPEVQHETYTSHDYAHHAQTEHDYTHHDNEDPVYTASHVEENEGETEEVEILGIEHDVDVFEDGNLMTVGAVAVGDDIAYVVDVDQDGYWDALVSDDNHNGQVDDGEVQDVTAYHESVSDWETAYAMQPGVNDGDTQMAEEYTEDNEYNEYTAGEEYTADTYVADDADLI